MRDKLGRFKKGHSQLNTGRTYFKKNQIPWNKRKKLSQKHIKNLSKSHKGKFLGSKHPRWKGGQKIDNGYIYILKPKHPFAIKSGYTRRSRLVIEKMLGRYLKPKEIVHHKGIKYPIGTIKNRQDDRIENLQLFPNHSEHIKFHYKLKHRIKPTIC